MTATEDITGTPLSFGQEQLWFLDQLNPGQTTYNILLANRLRGELNVENLRRALTIVVGRHEALRVTIHTADGTPYQVVSPAPETVELAEIDRTGLDEQGQEAAIRDGIRRLSLRPLDLEAGPLYRYQVMRLADDHHVLLQNLHHIATDGWSSGVVNAELSTAYQAFSRGDEPVFDSSGSNYLEYAAALRAAMRGETLDEELAFWEDRL